MGATAGAGGDVIVYGDSNLATLLDYTYRDSWVAERGQHGEGSNRSGKSGSDIRMPVPPGTVIRDHKTNELIGEILADGDHDHRRRQGWTAWRKGEFLLRHLHASVAALRAGSLGKKGRFARCELELKLIADVGLVGQPNAGKSTLSFRDLCGAS